MRQASRSNAVASRGARKRRRRLTFALSLLAVCNGCCLPEMIESACRPYEEMKRRDLLELRAEKEAKAVWDARYAGRYANNPCALDVRTGFIEAYAETALGGTGCPPPIPTAPIASRYTLTHSRPAAVPWYEGYHLGHAIAVARGVDRWRLAPIDPDLEMRDCLCQSTSVLPAAHVPAPVLEPEPEMQPEPLPPSSPVPARRTLPAEDDVDAEDRIEAPPQRPQPLGLPNVERP